MFISAALNHKKLAFVMKTVLHIFLEFVQSIPCLGNMVMQIQGGNAGLFSDPKAANCLMQVMQEKDVQEMMFETGTQAAIPNGLKNKPKIWKKLCE